MRNGIRETDYFPLDSARKISYPPRMDDISHELNDLFGVDEPTGKTVAVCAHLNDLFGVDEDLTNPVSSSLPEIVMPQFLSEARAASRPTPNPWDPRLVMDLAAGVDSLEDILPRYGLTREDYEALAGVPAFRRDLSTTLREFREKGITFGIKAKIQAEAYLVEIDEMIGDKSVPAATRLDAIKSVVKWGGLEPKETKTEQTSGVTVNLMINYAN